MRYFRYSAVLLTTLLSVSSAFAQTVLVTNAKIVTGSDQGIIENGYVLINGARIESVSVTDAALPQADEVIDAQGAWVTTGLMESASRVGLVEVEGGLEYRDYAVDKTTLGAGFRVDYAVNRFSSFLPMIRSQGITRAVLTPFADSSQFAGQAAVVDLAGKPDMVDINSAAVLVDLRESKLSINGGSHAKSVLDLLSALDAAKFYAKNKRAYETGKLKSLPIGEADLQALQPVIDGETPLALYINRAADIENVLKALDPYKLRIILLGAREGWQVTEAIASRDIPVILNGLDNLPDNFDTVGARLDNPALLAKAGIAVAFMSEDMFTDTKSLAQGAGTAVAYGMDWYQAIQAITVVPASIWGIADTYGTLASGKAADLLVWDGDPLEVTSKPTRIMINGEWLTTRTRQTELRDRYRNLGAGTEPYGYR
ncbi:MAG: amidohydrolase family protein [Pseudomonadales bacterium]|nr:amidohydrolase family protein [Pseudomonadales bacterium]